MRVRIVPADVGYHPGKIGTFALYDFPADPAKDECVEVLLTEAVGVRDTKVRHLSECTVARAAWTAQHH